MAHDVSPGMAPRMAQPKRIVVDDSEPQEVLIRVSVDAAGQAHSFQIMRGEAEQTAAALKAAKLWNFKPCAGRGACEQVLKYTDYGDSSRVQRIK